VALAEVHHVVRGAGIEHDRRRRVDQVHQRVEAQLELRQRVELVVLADVLARFGRR
jgi:hypothetical protein